jgi:uncharacterized protein (DUF302 family)
LKLKKYRQSFKMNPIGVITKSSPYSVQETIDRIVQFLLKHGAIIYARINQQVEVMNAGLRIAPLEFILFGNPKAGGPVMADSPVAALDLPLKIIAWEDGEKKVWIAFNDAGYIEKRYALPHSLMGPFDLDPMISKSLAG